MGLRGVWVTDTALTVLETAVTLPAGSTFLDRMLQTRVSLEALLRAHLRNPGWRGAKAAARVLAAASDRAGSDAERTLRRLLRRGGLTDCRVGYWAHGYEIDVAFPAAKVAVEVEVEVDDWVAPPGRCFRHDRTRQNVLVGDGWGTTATVAHMSTVASRDLRNHTADVLRQVSSGTRVTITVNGQPVAEISPLRSARAQFLSKADLLEIMARRQADPGLTDDLAALAGQTTADLGPL